MVSEWDSAASCRSKARSLQRDMEEQTSEIFGGGQRQTAGNPQGLLKEMDEAVRSRTSVRLREVRPRDLQKEEFRSWKLVREEPERLPALKPAGGTACRASAKEDLSFMGDRLRWRRGNPPERGPVKGHWV
ncbi:UNVERIFIED_CONTAM: hypothetical protein FKN15_070179 [Acipenser sinensis]